MKPAVIGLGGPKESGKDTVADYLVEEYGYVKIGMSDPLLDVMMKLNPWVPIFDADTPLGEQYPFTSFSHIVEERGYTAAKKENREVRRLLQVFGTEIGREMFGEEFWVDLARKRIRDILNRGENVVLTGVRFRNELDLIHEFNRQGTWYVRRLDLNPAPDAHPSENSVQRKDFYDDVQNYSDLDALYRKVDWMMKFYTKKG